MAQSAATDMGRLTDQPQPHMNTSASAGLVLPHTYQRLSSSSSSLALPPSFHQPQQQRAHQLPNQPQQAQQHQLLLHQQRHHHRQQQQGGAVAAGKKDLRITWAGSGIYFWWQLGAMQYLGQRYDLTRIPMAGASGGALCAVLARCGVDPELITESAYQLSLDHEIWSRPLGLVGVWGRIIEQWLDALLPPDAAERCRGEVGVVVTEMPSCRQRCIDDFEDKVDLINCVMASAHVPLLLDLQLSRKCRGVHCVDGSFPDFFTGAHCRHIRSGGDAVVFDYCDDPNIQPRGRMDMLKLKEYSEIKRIARMGAKYAARLEADGAFEKFRLDPVLLRRPPRLRAR